MDVDRPAISITVSTIQGWPDIERNVRSFEAAAARVGGELIVTDGSGRPAPRPDEIAGSTIWHLEPGASVYEMRSLAYQMSRAPVVAVTEDHCVVPPDWAASLLSALAAEPEAAAVGGSVENGARDTILDWASYFVVQATLIPPIASGRVQRIAGAGNVAYRRHALRDIDDFDGLGTMESLHQRQLRRSGSVLLADDSIRVRHDQHLDFGSATRLHYHAGRTFAGFLRHRMDRLAWFRFIALPAVPLARLLRAAKLASERGHGRTISRAWPMMLWLLYAQAAGHLLGFVVGPGDSPRRVQ